MSAATATPGLASPTRLPSPTRPAYEPPQQSAQLLSRNIQQQLTRIMPALATTTRFPSPTRLPSDPANLSARIFGSITKLHHPSSAPSPPVEADARLASISADLAALQNRSHLPTGQTLSKGLLPSPTKVMNLPSEHTTRTSSAYNIPDPLRPSYAAAGAQAGWSPLQRTYPTAQVTLSTPGSCAAPVPLREHRVAAGLDAPDVPPRESWVQQEYKSSRGPPAPTSQSHPTCHTEDQRPWEAWRRRPLLPSPSKVDSPIQQSSTTLPYRPLGELLAGEAAPSKPLATPRLNSLLGTNPVQQAPASLPANTPFAGASTSTRLESAMYNAPTSRESATLQVNSSLVSQAPAATEEHADDKMTPRTEWMSKVSSVMQEIDHFNADFKERSMSLTEPEPNPSHAAKAVITSARSPMVAPPPEAVSSEANTAASSDRTRSRDELKQIVREEVMNLAEDEVQRLEIQMVELSSKLPPGESPSLYQIVTRLPPESISRIEAKLAQGSAHADIGNVPPTLAGSAQD